MMQLDSKHDKILEKERYDALSETKLKLIDQESVKDTITFGSKKIPFVYRKPYEYYENQLSHIIKPDYKILDLCCGDGLHTFPLSMTGAEIMAVDISSTSIELCKLKGSCSKIENISFQVADIEKLNFPENTFDIITIVGSLSYVDLHVFFEQLRRIIKPHGYFACVDSLNENPFYRFNRYCHYLKGNRTASTLARMPNMKTIEFFRSNFTYMEVKYFEIFMFLEKLLTQTLGEYRSANIIEFLDQKMYFMKKYAFKFVLIASGIKK